MLICEDANSHPCYPYRCLMRPPMPGAVPTDGLSFCDFREGKTLSGHHFWGTAVYNRKLTDEEIEHYELQPTSFVVTD